MVVALLTMIAMRMKVRALAVMTRIAVIVMGLAEDERAPLPRSDGQSIRGEAIHPRKKMSLMTRVKVLKRKAKAAEEGGRRKGTKARRKAAGGRLLSHSLVDQRRIKGAVWMKRRARTGIVKMRARKVAKRMMAGGRNHHRSSGSALLAY